MISSGDLKRSGKNVNTKCAFDLSKEERIDQCEKNKKEIQNVKLQLKISSEVLQLG
jgi:hypothetical protein